MNTATLKRSAKSSPLFPLQFALDRVLLRKFITVQTTPVLETAEGKNMAGADGTHTAGKITKFDEERDCEL
jgi:hypothetical protein